MELDVGILWPYYSIYNIPDIEEYDNLIRLMLIKYDVTESEIKWESLVEFYFDKFHGNMFPLTYRIVDKYQQKYKELLQK